MADLRDPEVYYEAFLRAYGYLKNAADRVTLDLVQEDAAGFLHYSAYEQAHENILRPDSNKPQFLDVWNITEDKNLSNAMAVLRWQLVKLESQADFDNFPFVWENLSLAQVHIQLTRLRKDVPELTVI